MTRFALSLAAAAVSVIPTSAALADELFGGLYVHDVRTPLDLSGDESGVDLMVGWRLGKIGQTPLQPYVLGALNSAGNTSYAAVGISARFGHKVYVRPGLGIAIHNGSDARFDNPNNHKIEFGSRVLFEPELGVGFRLNSRLSLEASWVHMSHAQLRGKENPGIDNLGARLNLAL